MATTTRRRKPAPPTAAPLLALSVDSLADFLAIEHPDRDRLSRGLDIAIMAAQDYLGEPITPEALPNPIRHGIHMLAAQLLVTDRLEQVPAQAEIPAVIRALWSHANAGPAPI
jgi:hypothetical protein